jgi:hypothetical protein
MTNGPLKMKLHYFQRDPTKRIGGSPYTRDDMGWALQVVRRNAFQVGGPSRPF